MPPKKKIEGMKADRVIIDEPFEPPDTFVVRAQKSFDVFREGHDYEVPREERYAHLIANGYLEER